MLQQGIAEEDRLVGAGVCASTEASRDAIHAQAGVDLVCNNFAALRNLVLD